MRTIFNAAVILTVGLLAPLALSFNVFADAGHEHPPLAGHLLFKQNTLHMHATFRKPPVVDEEAFLLLVAKDPKTHKTIELDEKVEVILWMPGMGHGSGPTMVERAVDEQGNVVPGTFNVKNIYFIMSGDWEVRVRLTDAQGNQETSSFSLNLKN